MRSLKHSPSLHGFSHLASDGVYRKFSSRGEVGGRLQVAEPGANRPGAKKHGRLAPRGRLQPVCQEVERHGW